MRHLAIGPGAMGFFLYLGVIANFKRSGRLADLEELAGASAGALLGFLFCATKGEPSKVLDYALSVPVKQLMKPNIKSLLRDYGLVPTVKVRKILVEACRTFLGKDDVSFAELYAFHPVKFHASAFCVGRSQTVYFSVDTTPTMSVLDAVCASVAIPFLFSSVKLADGWNYIDGGATEAVPGGPFLGHLDVLALRLGWDSMTEVRDLKSYALNILYSTMKMRHNYEYPALELTIPDGAAFDFGASSDVKMRLFLQGCEQARNFSQSRVNAFNHPLGIYRASYPQDDHGPPEGRHDLPVHPQGWRESGAPSPDQGCGGDRQEHQGDRQAQGGYADSLSLPPGRGDHQPPQGPDQGCDQGSREPPLDHPPPHGHQHADQADAAPRLPHL